MKFTHGSHTLEVVWTILPAVTLLFIAIYQMNAWADAKMRRPDARAIHAADCVGSHRPAVRVAAALSGPSRRRAGHAATTSSLVNDLHLPVNEEILLRSEERRTCCTASSCPTCG